MTSEHWNHVYDTREPEEVSWFENEPTVSLELIDALGVTSEDSVLDVGAGTSTLLERLGARGHRDLTRLDVSGSALIEAGARSTRATHDVEADVTTWEPPRRYDLWHDRAVLHFLRPPDALRYAATLRRALAPDGAVVIGVFSPEGPTSCSGLEVTRYDAAQLSALLGEGFEVVAERRVVHVTPRQVEQSFQWIAARHRRA